jgi:hypothetical protein
MLVLEHVRSANPRIAAWQDRLDPLCGRTGGGCHHNRDTGAAPAAAGFQVHELQRTVFAGGPHQPRVAPRADLDVTATGVSVRMRPTAHRTED